MSHFGAEVELTRTTEKKWLKVGASIGAMANSWAGRDDLTAYVGSWVGADHGAPAAYNPATAEIEVNSDVAFDHGEPDMIGDFTNRAVQLHNAKAAGAIFHEACHARMSGWPLKETHDRLAGEKSVWDALVTLEEVRIEWQGSLTYPENNILLKASAMGIVLSDFSKFEAEEEPQVRRTAKLATLILGRVDAGILTPSDVENVSALVDRVIPLDVLEALRRVWIEFAQIRPYNLERMIGLARDWDLLVRTEMESQGQREEQPVEVSLQDILEAIGEDGFEVSMSVERDARAQAQVEEYNQQAAQINKRSQDRSKAKAVANGVFSSVTSNRSDSTLVKTRKPSTSERQAAVSLARALEKAQYRDRVRVESRSKLPPGRLRTRSLIQGIAQQSRGLMPDIEPWDRVQRRHVDDPPLTIGVMVDISGSMGAAMEPMASTAWVLSEAVRRVHGRVAMVYYGQDVFSTLKPGQHLDNVNIYTAPDSTEEFDKAYLALDGGLGLTDGTGARLLVIVSDGQYRPEQEKAVNRRLAEALHAGVAVLWLGAGSYGTSRAARYCRDSRAEFVPIGLGNIADIIDKVGALAAKALTSVGGR
jgi:hypothetical protein